MKWIAYQPRDSEAEMLSLESSIKIGGVRNSQRSAANLNIAESGFARLTLDEKIPSSKIAKKSCVSIRKLAYASGMLERKYKG